MGKKNKQKVETPETTEEKSEEVEGPIIPEVEEAAKEEAKEVEVPEEKPDSLPQFKNNGGSRDESKWITVRSGEVVTIPRKIALANKLKEVK